jgi:hypothetical protein
MYYIHLWTVVHTRTMYGNRFNNILDTLITNADVRSPCTTEYFLCLILEKKLFSHLIKKNFTK